MDLKKIWKLILMISSVVVTLSSAYLTNAFPVSASFIPQDKAYSISLTLYSGILAATFKVLDLFFNWIEKQKTTVKVEFAANRLNFKKLELVHCDFTEDIATIYMKVNLIGYPKKFLQKEIKLELPVQVTAQNIEKYSKYYEISKDKRSILIELEKLFNTDKINRIDDSIEFGFTVIKSDDEVHSYIETTLLETKRKIKLEKNKLLFTK